MKQLYLKKQNTYYKILKLSKISVKNIKLSINLGYITSNALKKIIQYNIIILLQKSGLNLSNGLRKFVLKLLKNYRRDGRVGLLHLI